MFRWRTGAFIVTPSCDRVVADLGLLSIESGAPPL